MLTAGLPDKLDPPPSEAFGNVDCRQCMLARLGGRQAPVNRHYEGHDKLISEVRSCKCRCLNLAADSRCGGLRHPFGRHTKLAEAADNFGELGIPRL